jgi:hypothetical protein
LNRLSSKASPRNGMGAVAGANLIIDGALTQRVQF